MPKSNKVKVEDALLVIQAYIKGEASAPVPPSPVANDGEDKTWVTTLSIWGKTAFKGACDAVSYMNDKVIHNPELAKARQKAAQNCVESIAADEGLADDAKLEMIQGLLIQNMKLSVEYLGGEDNNHSGNFHRMLCDALDINFVDAKELYDQEKAPEAAASSAL